MPATVFPRQDDVIRHMRFAPWHLDTMGPEAYAWLRANKPNELSDAQCWFPRDKNAHALNEAWHHTLAAIGAAWPGLKLLDVWRV